MAEVKKPTIPSAERMWSNCNSPELLVGASGNISLAGYKHPLQGSKTTPGYTLNNYAYPSSPKHVCRNVHSSSIHDSPGLEVIQCSPAEQVYSYDGTLHRMRTGELQLHATMWMIAFKFKNGQH